MPVAKNTYRFRFVILGRYPARLNENESQLTVNLATGHEDHVTHSGTLTLTEGEWDYLLGALRRSMQDSVEVEDLTEHQAETERRAASS
jgi:hypothetical protein